MPKDPEKPRTVRPDMPATPPAPLPSGDYSYTLEVVMGMQLSMGKLIEAVDTLKERSKEQSEDLKKVVSAVDTAKGAVKALLWVVGVVGALLGIILGAFVRQLFGHP